MRSFWLICNCDFIIICAIIDTMGSSAHTIAPFTSETQSIFRYFQLWCTIMHSNVDNTWNEFSEKPTRDWFSSQIIAVVILLLVGCMGIWFSEDVAKIVLV